jgi:hypothetical protein
MAPRMNCVGNLLTASERGTCVLNGCSTDQNAGNGIHISGVSPSSGQQSGIVIAGFKAHAAIGLRSGYR